jgi:predicted  nucleic acid-binding Zn-ribbon protein
MAKQKKSTTRAAEKELTAKLAKARTKRKEAEASEQKWKKRAKALRQDVTGLQTELDDVGRRLATAEASLRGAGATTGTTAPATRAAATKAAAKRAPAKKTPAKKTPAKKTPAKKAPAKKAETPARSGSVRPDDSWTVTALRAEARSRGLAGYSRKTKDQLLAELLS